MHKPPRKKNFNKAMIFPPSLFDSSDTPIYNKK